MIALFVLVSVTVYNYLYGDLSGDFRGFYAAGRLVRIGNAQALLDLDAQHALQESILGKPLDDSAVWVSPPYFAWLFVPLSFLPYAVSFCTFIAGSAVALWLSFRALSRELALGITPAFMLFIAIQYYPTFQWLLNAQMSALWLSAMTTVVVLLRRRGDLAAGLVLGFFACKPQLALGISVALLAAGRYRALLGAALTGAGLVALGFFSLPQVMHGYLSNGLGLIGFVRKSGYHTAGLHGSFELATLLLDGLSPTLANLVGCAATLFLLGAIYVYWRRTPWTPSTRAWDLTMAATLALGVIASPHLFVYDLMLLLLPLFMLVAHERGKQGLPLDAGPLLSLTTLVWVLGLLGPALTVAQQYSSRLLFGFPSALQIGPIFVFFWAKAVWEKRLSQDPL